MAQGGHVSSCQAGLLVSPRAALTERTPSLGGAGAGEATRRRRRQRGPALGTRGKRPAGTRGVSSGDMRGVDGTSEVWPPSKAWPPERGSLPPQAARPPGSPCSSTPCPFPKGSGHQFISHRLSRVGCRPRPQRGGSAASPGEPRPRTSRSPPRGSGARPASLSSRLHVLSVPESWHLPRAPLPFSRPPAEAGPPRLRAPVAETV